GQQLLPFMARLAVIVPVGAGMLAAMVEEADVVVLAFERSDLALDELVELAQVGRDVGGNLEIHGASSLCRPSLCSGRQSLRRRQVDPEAAAAVVGRKANDGAAVTA